MRVGMAVGLHYRNGHRQRVVIGKDTRLSGYMIENALVAGFTVGRRRRLPARPDPDAGGRHADALAARRLRRDDLRLAQSLRRQRHQALRAGRLQALRRGRGGDRGADRCRHVAAARRLRQARPRAAHRRRAGALHRGRQAHAAAADELRRPARRGRLRQRRRLQGRADGARGARRRGDQRSASSRTASTSTATSARPRRRRWPRRCGRCAPISASRSTATPIASCWSTRRAASSTATS